MLALTARQIATATGGQLLFGSEDLVASSVAIDSREASVGSAFFALVGERTDGHLHIESAVRGGASVIVLSDTSHVERLREALDPDVTALVAVADPTDALQLLAACQRTALGSRGDVPDARCAGTRPEGRGVTVIGVTGSTGKTSAKSFIASVLSQRYEVVATEGNQNNELGCPLTILRADQHTEVIVVEMGMRGPGEIAELCAIARPQFGVVTGVGPVHVERLGSVEGVARAKAELLAALPPAGGRGVIDAHGSYAPMLRQMSAAPIIDVSVGSDPLASIYADAVSVAEDGTVSATVRSTTDAFAPFAVHIPVPGEHHLLNALFAVAIGIELGLSPEQIALGIGCTTIPGMRFMPVFDAAHDVTFINDAYNANPTSMAGALTTFATVAPSARHLVVVGDMLELGALAPDAHRAVGALCAELGVGEVFAIGSFADAVREGADGRVRVRTYAAGAHAELARDLEASIEPGDYVLLKGSRGMALERVLVELGVRTGSVPIGME